ncbi:hypothetical protein KR018_009451, partial [Drosophila ironensis]
MDILNIPPNKPIDGNTFLEMLLVISLEEVLKFEYRRHGSAKWELLVLPSKENQTKYKCNICKVVQFGDKNLFSHLTGKKHNAIMVSMPALQMRLRVPGASQKAESNGLNANKNAQNQNQKNRNSGSNSNLISPARNPAASANKKGSASGGSTPKAASRASSGASTPNPVLKGPTLNLASKGSDGNLTSNAVSKGSAPNPASKGSSGEAYSNAADRGASGDSAPSAATKGSSKDFPKSNAATIQKTAPAKKPQTAQPSRNTDRSDIVINPLISCVPLSKLTDSTPVSDPEEVILIDEDPTDSPKSTIPIQTGQKSFPERHREREELKAKRNVALHAMRKNADKIGKEIAEKQAMATRSGLTFESKSLDILGLVGVEYVLKIVRNANVKVIRYLCCMCEITADELTMHNHLVGYNHRLKYFDKHFPTAMRQFRQYVAHVPEGDVCKIMMPIFDKLAISVEKHHGRESPYMCYEYYYLRDRNPLITKVFGRRHASELLGPSFTHVVDSKEVEKLIENARKSTPLLQTPPQAMMIMDNSHPYMATYDPHGGAQNYQSYTHSVTAPPAEPESQTVDDETHKRMVDKFLRGNRLGDSHSSRYQKRNRSRSPSPEPRKRSTGSGGTNMRRQWNVERRSLSPLRDGDIWQAYRHMVDQKVRDLNVSFAAFKVDPEQHPKYQLEWHKFWKRRKDELNRAGVDHRKYDFQNDWIRFFNGRLEELYLLEIEDIKIKCRERLCLPMTNFELANEKYHVNVPEEPSSVAESPVQNTVESPVKKMQEPEEPINVIHVLRLLTALESYLGSLGPFVTEMLAKALQAQRLTPDKVHSIMLTSENCAILETAKEKFTGLLISQIYEPTKEKALKKAINDTEKLLQVASEYIDAKEPVPINITSQPVPNPIVKPAAKKTVQKTDLAAQLASSLVSQGKTSINRDELQKILQLYNIIEQKKRDDDPSLSSDPAPARSSNHNPHRNTNDIPLTQHSSRDLNATSNATSRGTANQYTNNVARFNNQNTNTAN